MATFRVSVAARQPFNIPQNSVQLSVSGSWASIGDAAPGKGVRVQAIYWSSTTPGAKLRMRDIINNPNAVDPQSTPGGIWYDATCLGGEPCLDMFCQHLTLFAPFQYFDSEGGNTIIIYGEYT